LALVYGIPYESEKYSVNNFYIHTRDNPIYICSGFNETGISNALKLPPFYVVLLKIETIWHIVHDCCNQVLMQYYQSRPGLLLWPISVTKSPHPYILKTVITLIFPDEYRKIFHLAFFLD
jgi:hypothetical protein